MRRFAYLSSIVGILLILPLESPARYGEGLPIRGVYRVYAGSLADPTPPTATDRRVMFRVSGKTAKDLFDAIGVDKKDACSTEPGERIRKLDGEKIFCSRSAKGEYSCSFGFDLRTGKSIGGIVC